MIGGHAAQLEFYLRLCFVTSLLDRAAMIVRFVKCALNVGYFIAKPSSLTVI